MSFSHTDIYHDREKKNCAQVKTSSADTLVIKRELGSPFGNGLKPSYPVQFVCNGAKMQSLMFFSLMGAKCSDIARTPSLCAFDRPRSPATAAVTLRTKPYSTIKTSQFGEKRSSAIDSTRFGSVA